MLRKLNRLSALALCLTLLMGLLAVPASANYDIYVNAKDGIGLNLRTGPGTEYSKVRSQPIPMYTRLSISQTQDSAAGLPWGYTYYQGDSGWVCLVETTTYDPTPQQSTYTAANYDIYVNAKDGLGLNLRSGPGTDYSKLRSNPIPMYTKLHIIQTTYSEAGLLWGYTSYEGVSGWVCLVETTTYDPTPQAPTAPPVTQAPEAPVADTETPEPSAPATPEDAPTPPPMERTGSTGATIALSIIIVLLLIVVIFFVVMIIKLKKKP